MHDACMIKPLPSTHKLGRSSDNLLCGMALDLVAGMEGCQAGDKGSSLLHTRNTVWKKN